MIVLESGLRLLKTRRRFVWPWDEPSPGWRIDI
jgi:hypothetical protein